MEQKMKLKVNTLDTQENKYGELLPVWEAAGIPFLVDVFNKVLWDAKAADNYIYFHEMKDMGDHYAFTLNRDIRNLPTSWTDPCQDVPIRVPQMVSLDAERMARKYNICIEDLPASDKALRCDPALLERAQSGVLPEIEIAGEQFRIDMQSREFLKPAPDRARLAMRQMTATGDGLAYEFYYHLPTKCIVTVSESSRVLPADVVQVRIPRDEVLDPIAFARKHKLKVQDFVNEYPIQHMLKAKITPLWKTPLAAIIKKNYRSSSLRLPGSRRA